MTTETNSSNGKSKSKAKAIILAAVLAAILLLIIFSGGSESADDFSDLPTAIVTRDEMTLSLVESGEIMASENTIISNKMRWSAVIVDRVDEGATVAEGDLIIKFECKNLLDEIDSTELSLTSDENDYQQAKEKIEMTRKELANQLAQAEATIENKRNELDKFLKHEMKQEIQSTQSDLALNSQDLELAEGELNFMLGVNKIAGLEETYSKSSIDAKSLEVERLRLKVSNTEAELEKLKLYEHPQKQRQLELALEEALLEQERATLEAQAKQRQVEVDEQAKKIRLEKRKEKLTELYEQKEMLEIHAKSPGVIIYDSGNRWETPDLSIGASVGPRRNLMRIPNMSTLKVFSKVFEGASEKVKVGTPAIVTLDSKPGLVLKGTVEKVSPVASSENRWLNPNQKMFPIEVVLENMPDDIKPGSSAQVELILDQAKDVLQLNIAAVMTEQELSYVWKIDGGKIIKCPVTIGRTNTTHAEILDGLVEHDTVLLTSPPEDMLEKVKDLTAGYKPVKNLDQQERPDDEMEKLGLKTDRQKRPRREGKGDGESRRHRNDSAE